jgi:hypothetical protein
VFKGVCLDPAKRGVSRRSRSALWGLEVVMGCLALRKVAMGPRTDHGYHNEHHYKHLCFRMVKLHVACLVQPFERLFGDFPSGSNRSPALRL